MRAISELKTHGGPNTSEQDTCKLQGIPLWSVIHPVTGAKLADASCIDMVVNAPASPITATTTGKAALKIEVFIINKFNGC
jgi:hypothetical protein